MDEFVDSNRHRFEQNELERLEVVDQCRAFRELLGDDHLTDDELAQLYPDFQQLINQKSELERDILDAVEYVRETEQNLELYFEPEWD
jgi:predicted  nucleic acid-binding Zn-ribbon protein